MRKLSLAITTLALATLTLTGDEPHETSVGRVELGGRVKEIARDSRAPGHPAV
jgi:hypothetical protein